MKIKEKITRLRQILQKNNVKAYIIKHTDPHLSEYPTKHWKIVEWLSGFTGSNALLIITPTKARLWTDGRYFIQAGKQLENTDIELVKIGVSKYSDYKKWLANHLNKNDAIAIDGTLISVEEYEKINQYLKPKDIRISTNNDLLIQIWKDRPELPKSKAFEHELKYAGTTRIEKIKAIRKNMLSYQASHHIVSSLDDIAWTLNVRGEDIPYNPQIIAYLLIKMDNVILYTDKNKIEKNLATELLINNINLKNYDAIYEDLAQINIPSRIILDKKRINKKIEEHISIHTEIINITTIPLRLKASKSPQEIENIRNAHTKDGIAMVQFLYWLEKTMGKETITELIISDKLFQFRSQQKDFISESFPPIIGYKEHGAIVHYMASKETNAEIKKDGLLLIDSGGHYLDGTTDITRTVTMGMPTQQQKEDFTLVLKGHINMATAIFPQGTSGSQLDILARYPLLKHHRNYAHGTGHGVGYFLNVHEGPHSINPQNHQEIPLHSITSNEPGIYREGNYGIRIENLLLCKEKEKNNFGNFWQFETLTLCPLDRKLIEKKLLNDEEIEWINNYHKKIYKQLTPHLTDEIAKWLYNTTTTI